MRRILTILVLLAMATLAPNLGSVSVACAEGSALVVLGAGNHTIGDTYGEPGSQRGDPDRMGDDPTVQDNSDELETEEGEKASGGQDVAPMPGYLSYLLALLELLAL